MVCVVVRKNREAGRQGQRAASAGTVVPTSAGCKHRAWPPDRNTANTTCPLRAHPRGGREPRPPQRQSRQWGEPLTDGGDVARGKLVVGETEEEATFTDATVADQQQLDQVVVLGRHWEGQQVQIICTLQQRENRFQQRGNYFRRAKAADTKPRAGRHRRKAARPRAQAHIVGTATPSGSR